MAILSTAFPLSLEFEALLADRPRPAYRVSCATLEPFAALVGVIVLGQALPSGALLAIACVTAAIGVTLSNRRGRKRFRGARRRALPKEARRGR